MKLHTYEKAEIAFWLSVLLLSVLLAGCNVCTPTPAKYMCIAPQPLLLPSDTPDGVGPQQQASCMAPAAADAQAEIVAEVLAEDGIVERQTFLRALKQHPPTIEWRADGAYFYCGSVAAVGCTHGDWSEVQVADCVGHTALGHELVHVWLMRTHPSADDWGDPQHTLPVWQSESKWLARGHKELCEH